MPAKKKKPSKKRNPIARKLRQFRAKIFENRKRKMEGEVDIEEEMRDDSAEDKSRS